MVSVYRVPSHTAATSTHPLLPPFSPPQAHRSRAASLKEARAAALADKRAALKAAFLAQQVAKAKAAAGGGGGGGAPGQPGRT